jgi:hypothetical protein
MSEHGNEESARSRPLTQFGPLLEKMQKSSERFVPTPAGQKSPTEKETSVERAQSLSEISHSLLQNSPNHSRGSTSVIPLTEGSVWNAYIKTHEIELLKKDRMAAVVQTRGPGEGLFLIRRLQKEKLERVRNLLEQTKTQPFFLETREIFVSSTMLDLVCEHVNILLHHILGVSRFPSEAEVAAIAGQVSFRQNTR